MRGENCEIRNKKLLLISYFLLLIFIAACGRRGDPIAIAPYKEVGKDSNTVLVKGIKPEPTEVVTILPNVPTGLIAVYTQKSIVLTWDEIRGQEIKFYNVYRSEGKDFAVIGETVTSAFTDKNIEPSRKYYYRVTAVGEIEGPPSEEIEIVTKIH